MPSDITGGRYTAYTCIYPRLEPWEPAASPRLVDPTHHLSIATLQTYHWLHYASPPLVADPFTIVQPSLPDGTMCTPI